MKLSLIMAYYLNAGMLARQYQELAAYPDWLKQSFEYIVVDDGSPHSPASEVPRPDGLPKLSIFRIKVDVRWNQDAARNIGAHHAQGEWLLLTDMDHLIPQSTMAAVLGMRKQPNYVYTFRRVSAPDHSPYKPHPNSWLMERALYQRMQGYDERFAGYYGTDSEFRERLRHVAFLKEIPAHLVRVPRDVIPDASTTTYLRKQPNDRSSIAELLLERRRNKLPIINLSFPYEQVL